MTITPEIIAAFTGLVTALGGILYSASNSQKAATKVELETLRKQVRVLERWKRRMNQRDAMRTSYEGYLQGIITREGKEFLSFEKWCQEHQEEFSDLEEEEEVEEAGK